MALGFAGKVVMSVPLATGVIQGKSFNGRSRCLDSQLRSMHEPVPPVVHAENQKHKEGGGLDVWHPPATSSSGLQIFLKTFAFSEILIV